MKNVDMILSKANAVLKWGLVAGAAIALTACSSPNDHSASPPERQQPSQPLQPNAPSAPLQPSAPTLLPMPSQSAPQAQSEPVMADPAQDPAMPKLLSVNSWSTRLENLSFRDNFMFRMTNGYYDAQMGCISDYAPYVSFDHQHINMLSTLLR